MPLEPACRAGSSAWWCRSARGGLTRRSALAAAVDGFALLDFLDVHVDRQGVPWGAFVDACDPMGCYDRGEGVVSNLEGGPAL